MARLIVIFSNVSAVATSSVASAGVYSRTLNMAGLDDAMLLSNDGLLC